MQFLPLSLQLREASPLHLQAMLPKGGDAKSGKIALDATLRNAWTLVRHTLPVWRFQLIPGTVDADSIIMHHSEQ